jgi:hypothetical protein
MFRLRGVVWNEDFDYIEKTNTEGFLEKEKEIISDDVYVRLQHSRITFPVKCWWCRMTIKKLFPLPVKYIAALDSFFEQACFCSPNCAKAYSLEAYPTNKDLYENVLALLEFQNRNSNGAKFLAPSPDWRLLKEYGGVYNSVQFRNMIGKDTYEQNPSYKVKGHIPISSYFKEIKNDKG